MIEGPAVATKRHRDLEERHDPRLFAPWRSVNIWRDGRMVTINFPVEAPETALSGDDLKIARDEIAKLTRLQASSVRGEGRVKSPGVLA